MFRALTAAGAALAFAATGFSPGTAAAADDPPPDRVIIELTTVNGRGCPAGTMAVAVSPDNTAFTLMLGPMLAQVGVGSKPNDDLKQCQVRMMVRSPRGYTYAIDRADYTGMLHLEKGASGTVSVKNNVQGDYSAPMKRTFTGPADESWRISNAPDPLVYAPCYPSSVDLNVALRVSAGTSDTSTTTSFLALDSADGYARADFHLAWKRCPAA
ncbi:DUF4360 domain-containing protein [Streptomyces roseoverticillatus]|uniref:DUF4360 domain-containing protein n=1 Tax=Streptomyces roseoverticillatus TaxID=66429 RepID=UPI001F3A2012|nr:DUF4360 domain-containing protein [Streptomyces roseoverticillatus]MCF3101155.1 DUF4360 domain-containing protein [Streptomyces roseoverticillatus]